MESCTDLLSWEMEDPCEEERGGEMEEEKKAGVLLGLFPLLEGPCFSSLGAKSLLMKAVSLAVRRWCWLCIGGGKLLGREIQ